MEKLEILSNMNIKIPLQRYFDLITLTKETAVQTIVSTFLVCLLQKDTLEISNFSGFVNKYHYTLGVRT